MMTERRSGPSWRSGFRPLVPLTVLWLLGSAFLVTMVRQNGIPYADLLLDPAQFDRRPWYTGLISNLGVLGWAVAAVAAGGGGWLAGIGGRDQAGQLLRGGSLLSGLLLLDDLFQFHIIVPKTLGAPKMAFYGLYAGLGTAWAYSNRSEFSRTRWHLLVAALLALGGSAFIDFAGDGRSTSLLAEDSAKFLGILAWALYFVLTVGDISRSIVWQGRRVMESNLEPQPAVLAFDPDQKGGSKKSRKSAKQEKVSAHGGGGTTAVSTGPRTAASTVPADTMVATPVDANQEPAAEPMRTVRLGPSKVSRLLDRVATAWRSLVLLWLPIGLLCYLCYRTVMLFIGT